MNAETLNRMMAPMARRVRSMVARCVLAGVDADDLRQTLQVKLLAGEAAADVEHFEPYGFTSHPLDGDGVFLAVGGNRSHGVVMNIGGKTYRLRGLKPGECALYDDQGNKIVLERNQITINALTHLDVTAPTCHVTATTTHDGNVTVNGNVIVDGNITATGEITDGTGSMTDMRGVYNGHTHPENDDGGPTDPPNQEMG